MFSWNSSQTCTNVFTQFWFLHLLSSYTYTYTYWDLQQIEVKLCNIWKWLKIHVRNFEFMQTDKNAQRLQHYKRKKSTFHIKISRKQWKETGISEYRQNCLLDNKGLHINFVALLSEYCKLVNAAMGHFFKWTFWLLLIHYLHWIIKTRVNLLVSCYKLSN